MQALIGLLRIMRPKQWVKNLIIFAGIVFDGQLLVSQSLIRVIISFILLTLVAGTIYIVNDIVDIENDRKHPRKKNRPLPSGQLPIKLAIVAAVIFPIVGIGGAWLFLDSPRFALLLLGYMLLHFLYSVRLKHIVLIDILAITAGYVLRVAAGTIVIEVARFSPWLYACTALLAMFLAIGKRRQELVLLGDNAAEVRPIFKHYNMPLLDEMLRFVVTSTFLAYLIYTIETPSLLGVSNLGLLSVPSVTYALLRYLYIIHVKGEGSAPEEVLLSDRPLQLAILAWGFTFILIIYIPRLLLGM